MKPGTIIRLPDGREGTVVYHNLDGYGVVWGRVSVSLEDLQKAGAANPGVAGIVQGAAAPDDYPYHPEAMLRDPWPGAQIECVGAEYEIVP